MEELIPRFNKIKNEIEIAQKKNNKIKILFGAEIAYSEGWIKNLEKLIKEFEFDFIIGSIHIIDDIVISSIKHSHKIYDLMPEEKAYKKYFNNLYKFVEWGKFDVIGHFDINKKYGHEAYGKFEPKKYEKEIRKILKLAAKKNIGIELNTSNIHSKCFEVFPSPQILKWALEDGITNFTLGSDAHEPIHINRYLKEAIEIAKDIGIKTISTYRKHIPTKHKI